jgi:O-antigen ligase
VASIQNIRRIVCFIAGLPFLAVGVLSIRIFFDPTLTRVDLYCGIVLVVSTTAFGLGLLTYRPWARTALALLCVLVSIVLPAGYINPFMAMETLNPPPLQEILLWMVPLVVGLLVLAWLVHPPRTVSEQEQPN